MNDFLLTVHFTSALLSVIRIVTYKRHGAIYRFWPSLYATVLFVVFGLIVIAIVTRTYGEPHALEVLLNCVICTALYAVRGNVSRLLIGGIVKQE